jgi:HK97 family phage portal protein
MRLFGRRKLEERDLKPITSIPIYASQPVADTSPVLEVDQFNALRVGDAWACVRVLADSISTLPVRVFRDTGSGRVPVPDGRLSRLLARPSPGSTSADLFSSIMCHLQVNGNCYLGKWRDSSGEIVALSPLPPTAVTVVLKGNEIGYWIWLPDQDQVLFSDADILHIKGMCGVSTTYGGDLVGLSPVTMARLTLTLSSNLQESSHAYFLNGSRPSGILSVAGAQNDATIEAIRERWDTRHAGTENMSRVAVLSGQATFTPVSFSADDSQFLEQRELSAREVARVFRVPGWMIDATPQHASHMYSNVNQANLNFVTHTLRPWLTRIERAFSADSDLCPGGTYLAFDLDNLLRGDPDLRTTIYQRALGTTAPGVAPGWMTVEEIREIEDLPPIEPEPAVSSNGAVPSMNGASA